MGSTTGVRPEDLPDSILEGTASPTAAEATSLEHGVREAKKRLVMGAFAKAGGAYAGAAKLLGVNTNYLYSLVKKLHLKDHVMSHTRDV